MAISPRIERRNGIVFDLSQLAPAPKRLEEVLAVSESEETFMSLTCGGLHEAKVSTRPAVAPVHHFRDHAGVPHYLNTHYWWAYVHPRAVQFFERQWLTNLILWGNYDRLRDAALGELGERLPGRTLQVACVYGDLTCRLNERVAAGGGTLDVIDVLPVQLDNLRRKLPADAPAQLLRMDSARLEAPDGRYDRAVMFFLLHEQPREDRERTLSEVLRVVRPGGTIVIVDYAQPRWWHPLRYLWSPLLATLEPFALDLWRREIADWLPAGRTVRNLRRQAFFGGLYQKLVVTRGA
jgi:ubiquinone/menaquinone biosynthesis C-methylase UbiE